MAIRFAIGPYALVALAVLLLAACGGGDGGDGVDATDTPASLGSNESSCLEGVLNIEVGIPGTRMLGSVVEVEQFSGTEPGFENMTVVVNVDDSVVQVVLLGELITEVKFGDCVSVAGQEQRWACGSDCEDVGFVASFFEVREPE